MPNVTFKAKLETIYNTDDTVAYTRVAVPVEVKRTHCDMAAFRTHPRFGSYANSDLFPAMLKRALKEAGIGAHIRMDRLPDCVTVDTSGFLARVTIDVA